MMRKIYEVVEDIKSILNNVERAQEYNGETLVDIDELIDEILSIDAKERKEVEEAKKLFDRIYRNDCFLPNEIELFNKIEKALGFKLYFWQKTFLIVGHFRQTGESTARCLKQLFGASPINYSQRPKNAREHCERNTLWKIKEQLQRAGIETVPILTCEKDIRDYKKMHVDGFRVGTMIIDELHAQHVYKKPEDNQ